MVVALAEMVCGRRGRRRRGYKIIDDIRMEGSIERTKRAEEGRKM